MNFETYLVEGLKAISSITKKKEPIRKFVTKTANKEHEDSLKKKELSIKVSAPIAIKEFKKLYKINTDSLYSALGFDSEREAENETGDETDYDFSIEVPLFIEKQDNKDITSIDLKNIKNYLKTISMSSKDGSFENLTFTTSDKPGTVQVAINTNLN